jgi:hypothetical protein
MTVKKVLTGIRGPVFDGKKSTRCAVKGRISVRGAIMVGGQRIQVGLTHAGKTADVTIETDTFPDHRRAWHGRYRGARNLW